MTAKDDRKVIVIRFPRPLLNVLDHYTVEQDLFRQDAIEQLVMEGLRAKGWEVPEVPEGES